MKIQFFIFSEKIVHSEQHTLFMKNIAHWACLWDYTISCSENIQGHYFLEVKNQGQEKLI